MSDLVERLRAVAEALKDDRPYAAGVAADAIAEVERLTRERDEARENFSALERAIVGETGASAILTVEAQKRELTTLTARTREVLAPLAQRAEGAVGGFDGYIGITMPITLLRAANTLFNELKEKDNG